MISACATCGAGIVRACVEGFGAMPASERDVDSGVERDDDGGVRVESGSDSATRCVASRLSSAASSRAAFSWAL